MMMFGYGEKYIPASQLKNGIVALELGKEIGLKTGDKILSIGGEKIKKFSDLLSSEAYLGTDVKFEIEREGKQMFIPVPADFLVRLSKAKDRFIDKRQSFYIRKITPNTGADRAGLEANDIIT